MRRCETRVKLARSRRVEYPCGVVVLRADVTREDCGQQCNSLIVRCQRKARVRREGGNKCCVVQLPASPAIVFIAKSWGWRC